MKLERLLPNCFGQEISVLKGRRYVDDRYLFPPYQFLDKAVPYVNVRRVGVGDTVLRKLHRTLIILEHRNARHPDIM